MRMLLAVLAVGAVGMVLVPAAVAQTPVGDSVTGSGNSSVCGGPFEIDAHSRPSGENPTGEVTCASCERVTVVT